MNKTNEPAPNDEMLPEYRFDYAKAKPNRFAAGRSRVAIVLDEDVAEVFRTPEEVNKALRAFMEAMPKR